MKSFKVIAVLAVIAIVLYITNPPLATHEGAIGPTIKLSPEAWAEAREKYGPSVSDMAQGPIHYQNYGLFSTTTDDEGGRLSIGILRMVFSLRSSNSDTSK